MQITDPDWLDYIRHRLGEQRIESRPNQFRRKALELNRPAPDFSTTYGKLTMNAYVGFVDLADFSKSVHGKTPDGIVDYLEPFLREVLEILRGRHALIDKTIGDEAMFVLPEVDEDDGREVFYLGQALGALHDLAFKLGGEYRFRFSLSYGAVRFFEIDALGYSEWTTVGEPVHVAKRLQTLPEVHDPQPVVGAFGMCVSEAAIDEVKRVMTQQLAIIAGYPSHFDYRFGNKPVNLKGVGEVFYAVLSSKTGKQ